MMRLSSEQKFRRVPRVVGKKVFIPRITLHCTGLARGPCHEPSEGAPQTASSSSILSIFRSSRRFLLVVLVEVSLGFRKQESGVK